jgi:hypothetical protein
MSALGRKAEMSRAVLLIPFSASATALHPHRERRKPDVFERETITLVCFFASGKQNSFAMRLTDAVWRPSALAIAKAVDF